MRKQTIIDNFATNQRKVYGRNTSSYQKFILGEFFDYLGNIQYELPEEEIIKAIEKDSKVIARKQKNLIYNFQQNKINVALITEDVGHLTGGRYYTWFIAFALVELGHNVTVYTNRKPVFEDAFKGYKQPNIQVVAKRAIDLRKLDVNADLYIGSPTNGNVAALRLGDKYSKPSFTIVFDPFPMMEQFIGKRNYAGWDEYLAEIPKSNAKIISLCESTSEYIYPWLNKRKDQVVPIYPCINSIVKEKALEKPVERGDYVLFISRLVRHKKFEDALAAAKKCGVRLKVVSSVDGIRVKRLIKQQGMEGQVDLHMKVSDEEKFRLIKGARAVINAAIFEGFGMWAIEALSCGTPLVSYDYPTMREIKHVTNAENMYLAEWNNPNDLARKLKLCLDEAKYSEENHQFDFKAMTDQLKDVFKFEPRIGVITIALNEDQFIEASLKSVTRHPNVKKVAVVEGAVNLFAHAATKEGLSIDQTPAAVHKAMKTLDGRKIVYERYGWATDKSELRNRALELLGKDIDYVLVVDGDELWKQEDLDKLVQTFRDNPRAGVIKFPFYHFWKSKDQVTVGSQWDSMLFRCFKFEDKSLRWIRHELPVFNDKGERIDRTNGSVINKQIHVYHYGYCKKDDRVKEKLRFYSLRDKNLKVQDTYTKWRPGQPTQPTHGGGRVVPFKGTHPEELKGVL